MRLLTSGTRPAAKGSAFFNAREHGIESMRGTRSLPRPLTVFVPADNPGRLTFAAMRHALLLLVLAATWLLWSGLFQPLLLTFGAASCLLTLYLAHRMGVFRQEVFLLHLLRKLPGYWLWLGAELVKSNLHVARIVLTPTLPISPTVVEFQSLAHGPVGHALLANSITLTPGTVTIDENEGRLKVHCLTRESARDLLAGEMNRRVAAIAEG